MEVGIVLLLFLFFLCVEKKLAGLQAELHVPQRYQLPVYFSPKVNRFFSCDGGNLPISSRLTLCMYRIDARFEADILFSVVIALFCSSRSYQPTDRHGELKVP